MLKDYISQMKGAMGAEHTEIRAQRNTSRRVGILNGDMISNSRSEESGVCARVYRNGVYGFASGAEYSESAVREILEAAQRNAKFMDERTGKGKPALPVIAKGTVEYKPYFSDPEQKAYIDFVREVDAYIAKKYPKLVSRRVTAYADSMEKLLVTNDGADGYSIAPRTYVPIVMTANSKDGSTVEMFRVLGAERGGCIDEKFKSVEDFAAEIEQNYEMLMAKAEGVYAEAGVRDVILGPNMAGILAHEAVGHTVEADLVLGGSVAAHLLGKPVASELVTMVDFAHTLHDGSPAPLPVYIDDEGTPATDELIIKDGILVGYMNSRESAQHFGMEPHGNARAYTFSDEPLIRMRNTGILPGKSKIEEMIASIKDGYYLTETGNGQADTTGEFMFGVNMGYEIKNGKLGRAIRDTTISGIAFEMLKTVDMLSDDNVWVSSGFCGKKQPMPVGMGGPALKCRINIGGR